MKTGHRHFSTASLGVALAAFSAVAADVTYTWQAVDGVWDGNATDRAHWACSSADRFDYPQNNSCKAVVPQNVRARITIDVNHVSGKWELQAGSHVTFTSLNVGDGDEMAHMEVDSLVTKAGSTFILDHAKISDAYQISLQAGVTGIVRNASWFYCSNSSFYINSAKPPAYFEVSGKSAINIGNIYIGDGCGFVIDDSTVTCRARLAVGTDRYANRTSDSSALLFKGAEPKLVFNDGPSENGRNLQACGANPKLDGDVLHLDFLVPEGGFASTPISIVDGDASKYLFGGPNDGATPRYGKFRINVLDESPAAFSPQRVEQNLVEWKTRKALCTGGFDYNNIIEGNLPKKAEQKSFASGLVSETTDIALYAYSVTLKGSRGGTRIFVQ
jgi:hypothetical protein